MTKEKPRRKTLRDYTREKPSAEDERRFRNAMNEPSAMVVAVLMAIELEYLLENLIVGTFKRRDEETVSLLCKDNGALATFFSKIGLAYALGLIDEVQMEHLHTVRRIRNAFAHSRKQISFATEEVRRELRSVPLPTNQEGDAHKGITLTKKIAAVEVPGEFAAEFDDVAPRAGYVILCMTISRALHDQLLVSLRGMARSYASELAARAAAFSEPDASPQGSKDDV